jgi:hypothetical protein
VERVTFQGTTQGVRIKSARGRGNDIGNFVFRDITMTDVVTPIQITAYYTGGMAGDTAQPVTAHTPRFHDITIENLTATGARQAGVIYGLPESPVKHVVLKNVHITAQKGLDMQYARRDGDEPDGDRRDGRGDPSGSWGSLYEPLAWNGTPGTGRIQHRRRFSGASSRGPWPRSRGGRRPCFCAAGRG